MENGGPGFHRRYLAEGTGRIRSEFSKFTSYENSSDSASSQEWIYTATIGIIKIIAIVGAIWFFSAFF
jgi:hypothetical protein